MDYLSTTNVYFHYIIYGFAIILFLFWLGEWGIHIIAIFYAKVKLHRKIVLCSDDPIQGVSILKPLMGLDPNLLKNLETFFQMDYPLYELLFCIENANDAAVGIVQELISKYPHVDASIYLGGSQVGVNPKINNMFPAYCAAKYELIMISDSGIRMKIDTLTEMVSHLYPDTGLVHQMPFTYDRDGFAAAYEKIFFGTVQARIYLSADFLQVNCLTGMSCILRRCILDEMGGLSAFGCYLAEDYFIAKAIKQARWRTRVTSQPAQQNSGLCNVSTFQERLKRWAKLRVAMLPSTILLEPLSECFIVGLFAAWSVNILFHWDSITFYLCHVLVWFLLDWKLLNLCQNDNLSFSKVQFFCAWLLRELSGPILFLQALAAQEIRWRSRIFKLEWGGLAREIFEEKC